MSGRMARNKGQRGEREVANKLIELGYGARRGYQARLGGKDEPDVVSNFPFRIEVKYCQTLNIYKAFEQVEIDNPGSNNNIVVFRRNGQPWRVALEFDKFLELCQK
jgi:Holliday junction resolvase